MCADQGTHLATESGDASLAPQQTGDSVPLADGWEIADPNTSKMFGSKMFYVNHNIRRWSWNPPAPTSAAAAGTNLDEKRAPSLDEIDDQRFRNMIELQIQRSLDSSEWKAFIEKTKSDWKEQKAIPFSGLSHSLPLSQSPPSILPPESAASPCIHTYIYTHTCMRTYIHVYTYIH